MKTLSAQQRRQIIGSLSRVNGDSIVAYGIQKLVRDAATKTDEEIIDFISHLKSQCRDGKWVAKCVLGKQFRFITALPIPSKY